MRHSNWIRNAAFDSFFILSPPFLCLLTVLVFPGVFQGNDAELGTISWVVLILCVDVAHVYSTLFRTYFDPTALAKGRNLLWGIPLACFATGAILYSIDPMIFWRSMAYLAVFHFVRQQYGFMRIYSRNEDQGKFFRIADAVFIYSFTFIPILIWHFSGPKNFDWFVEGDFFYFPAPALAKAAEIFLFFLVGAWVIKEVYLLYKGSFNLPRILLMGGTFLSWYFGLVYFNGDLAFTALNVISHGIPYMALIWAHGRKKHLESNPDRRQFVKIFFTYGGVILFAASMVFFGYVEEGFWDGLVWKDHPGVFSLFSSLPQIENKTLLGFVIPLLALPQLTHYVIDGFIWKLKKDEFNWKDILR